MEHLHWPNSGLPLCPNSNLIFEGYVLYSSNADSQRTLLHSFGLCKFLYTNNNTWSYQIHVLVFINHIQQIILQRVSATDDQIKFSN